MFRKRHKSIFGAIILIALIIAGCQQQPEQSNVIVVSILPQKFFTEKIIGDHFQVEVMIPPGASPATYDPTPRQLAQLSKASVYFKIGYIGFEKSWIPKLESEYPELPFIDLSRDVQTKSSVEHHDGHDHGGIEPHIWMSPKNARIIAKNIWEAVCNINPEEREFYTSNYKSLLHEIDDLEIDIQDKLENLSKSAFIIYHPALTYFAEDYGLVQYAIEKDGKEPSASYMAKIINRAHEKDIRLIFIQKEFNQNEALTLEREIDGKVVSIDPLAYNWIEQMKFITQQLSIYLK